MSGSTHNNNVGRAGEFLALSRLSFAGISCILVQHEIDDAYLKTPSGKLLTLQVKTASRKSGNLTQYRWNTQPVRDKKSDVYALVAYRDKKSDVYALVAYDIKKIYWARGDDPIIKKTSTRLYPEQFAGEEQLLKQVINSFNE
jgi:hypothetical protein